MLLKEDPVLLNIIELLLLWMQIIIIWHFAKVEVCISAAVFPFNANIRGS